MSRVSELVSSTGLVSSLSCQLTCVCCSSWVKWHCLCMRARQPQRQMTGAHSLDWLTGVSPGRAEQRGGGELGPGVSGQYRCTHHTAHSTPVSKGLHSSSLATGEPAARPGWAVTDPGTILIWVSWWLSRAGAGRAAWRARPGDLSIMVPASPHCDSANPSLIHPSELRSRSCGSGSDGQWLGAARERIGCLLWQSEIPLCQLCRAQKHFKYKLVMTPGFMDFIGTQIPNVPSQCLVDRNKFLRQMCVARERMTTDPDSELSARLSDIWHDTNTVLANYQSWLTFVCLQMYLCFIILFVNTELNFIIILSAIPVYLGINY